MTAQLIGFGNHSLAILTRRGGMMFAQHMATEAARVQSQKGAFQSVKIPPLPAQLARRVPKASSVFVLGGSW